MGQLAGILKAIVALGALAAAAPVILVIVTIARHNSPHTLTVHRAGIGIARRAHRYYITVDLLR